MFEVFKYVDKFFTSLTNYLTYNDIFIIFVGLFLFTTVVVLISTANSYEAKLIKAIDKFNAYFIDNPQINEDNLVAFNQKMKARFVPKQLRKSWQQFVLYRENKASAYMSFENCVSNPIKNSSYKRDTKLMSVFSYIFSVCALILNCYYCYETADLANVLSSVLLTPVIILLLNYIMQIFFKVKHSAIVSDLFQNYQYFEVNIDKATETLPEYVDYEVLFDRNEIKKGIPILYAYLQKRAEEEKRELERARLKNVEHEKFNFDDTGVEASLVLERAMQEAENYIAERKKYNQDTQQINSDITQEDMNYREITKEYNRQMQVSKETFENFKTQLADASSTIEANYLKKQQQQELDRQRNLERDFDTATERHKKVIEGYAAELDAVDKFIAESRKTLENAMKSEFSTYSSKVYDAAKKAVEEREKEKYSKLKAKIEELEEELVVKKNELKDVYDQNQNFREQLENFKSFDGTSGFETVPTTQYQPQEIQEEAIQSVEGFVQPEEIQPIEEPEYQEFEYVDNNENYETFDESENYDQENEELFDSLENQDFETYQQDNEQIDYGNEFENIDYLEDENFETEDGFVQELAEPVQDVETSTAQENDSIESKPVSRRGRPRKVVDVVEQGEKRGRGRPRKEDAQAGEVKASPVKKGRGRPKKVQNNAEEVKKESRGRGRPRKEDGQTGEVKASPVKKGRGRPKKVQDNTEEVKKESRGRGRPRKDGQAGEIKVSPVKKGRGRPKKVQDNTEEVKKESKGRGRPRKQVAIEDKIQSADNIEDIDEYLKQIDNQIAEENAKLEETQKELAKNTKLRRKK